MYSTLTATQIDALTHEQLAAEIVNLETDFPLLKQVRYFAGDISNDEYSDACRKWVNIFRNPRTAITVLQYIVGTNTHDISDALNNESDPITAHDKIATCLALNESLLLLLISRGESPKLWLDEAQKLVKILDTHTQIAEDIHLMLFIAAREWSEKAVAANDPKFIDTAEFGLVNLYIQHASNACEDKYGKALSHNIACIRRGLVRSAEAFLNTEWPDHLKTPENIEAIIAAAEAGHNMHSKTRNKSSFTSCINTANDWIVDGVLRTLSVNPEIDSPQLERCFPSSPDKAVLDKVHDLAVDLFNGESPIQVENAPSKALALLTFLAEKGDNTARAHRVLMLLSQNNLTDTEKGAALEQLTPLAADGHLGALNALTQMLVANGVLNEEERASARDTVLAGLAAGHFDDSQIDDITQPLIQAGMIAEEAPAPTPPPEKSRKGTAPTPTAG